MTEGDGQRIWETARDLTETSEKDARHQENKVEVHNDEGD